MNKKILISLSIIGLVTAIVLGTTGAWWTDSGVSQNQSFKSGTLDLRLSNTASGGYVDNISNTWNVDKMAPGGAPYVSTLYMKNIGIGSVNADYLKFTLVNNPSIANMDKRMRITQLDYAGNSLLSDGAGADLSSYEAPTNCDINVQGDHSTIIAAVAAATAGDVICVQPGNYSTGWEGGVINVNKGVTIASTDGLGSTTISAGVKISADNVTIRGFKLTSIVAVGGGDKKGIYLGDHDGVTIEYNEIDGTGVATPTRGIVTEGGANYTNVSIENNVIHNLTTGIYTNPHTGIVDIKYNDIYNTAAGIGGFTGATVEYNVFHDNSEAIGADVSYTNATLQYNNFLGGDKVVKYGAWPNYDYGAPAIVAENNWWGDFDPSDQVFGNVDYSPYAGGPFIGYINGSDYNSNGFADLDDFEHSIVVVENPDLLPNSGSYHTLKMGVQLDGPTAGNSFMGGTVGMDMTVTMGQGPAQ